MIIELELNTLSAEPIGFRALFLSGEESDAGESAVRFHRAVHAKIV